jgi:hypothetical protein
MAPQDLRCSAVSPQSVRVRWDPPPPEHRNGVIEGYKVLYRHINLQGGEKLCYLPSVLQALCLTYHAEGLAAFNSSMTETKI